MEATSLRARWARGDVTYGAWCSLAGSAAAEIIGRAGFDHVCVDLQHGLIDHGAAVPMLQALDLGTAAPLVRVPVNEPSIIGKALDAGAVGVIVPMVNRADDARAAVDACHYPPAGTRSYGPTRAHVPRGDGYVERANAEVACIVMIETAGALAAVDDILAVPGIAAVYVGPADLSVSLGLPPGNNDGDAVFDDALATVVAACQSAGVVAGVHATAALAAPRLAAGFQMVTVTSDVTALTRATAADLAAARGG